MSKISLPPKGDAARKLGSNFAPLKAEAQATPNMTVQVSEGSFWTANNEHQEYIGGTSPTISAPGSDAKWVLVTVKNTGVLNIVNGVSSASPQLPDVSTYTDELPIAAIFVGDTTTALTNDMIYDLRPLWSIPPDSVSQTQLNDFATITYVDNVDATKADKSGTPNANFTLNVGGTNINDSGIYIDRFSGSDVGIRFNETAFAGSPPVETAQWEFTNDGATWNPIGVAGGSYYTKTDLNGGALDFLYYTQNDLNVTGILDSRYYTETESDALFAPLTHTHLAADITDFPVAGYVETVNSIAPVLGNITFTLNDLNDVTNATPTDSHVIVYRTGSYTNGFLTTNDLSDVNTIASAPVVGDVLIHNGGGFVNRPLIKDDISDFLGTDFLLITNVAGDAPAGDGPIDSNGTAQDVYGVKTFKDGLIIESSLTVTGGNTSIETTELRVSDPYIDINWGETGNGVGNGTGVAGIRVDRGTGGSPDQPNAIIIWNEAAVQWEFGVEGNASQVLTTAHTHVSSQISDFDARVTTELGQNNLTTIQDVDYIGIGPVTGEYLRYNFATSNWENNSFATDVQTELNTNNLNELQDVTYLGSPNILTTGDSLQWNGSSWENHVPVKVDITDFTETDYIHTTGNEVKTGNLTINGNFTIGGGAGTITTIDSEALNILDSVITLNAGEIDAGVAGGVGNAGLQIDRGTSADVSLWWSELAKTWQAHHTISIGSPVSPTLTIGELSFIGHDHIVADITDISISATEINSLTGILTDTGIGANATVAQRILDRISRRGDTMNSTANLTFVGGGEVLGLPATPSVNDAATSKLYVDTHIADTTLHMTTEQNTFLDTLTLTGSPALAAADVNQLVGISGNVQTLLDTKTDKLTPAVNNNLAGLDITTGNIIDSGVVVNDAGTLASEIWTADKIDTTKADKIIPALTNNLARLDVTGNLDDSGLILNDAGTLASEIWSASQIDTVKADKIIPALVGNFASLDANGNLLDSGVTSSTFAAASHTHVVTEITDFAAGVLTELNANSIDALSDVNSSTATAGDFLRFTSGAWANTAASAITEFVRTTGNESIAGIKTFNDDSFFQQNVTITNDLTVNGATASLPDTDVTGTLTVNGSQTVSDNNIIINFGSTASTTANGGGILLQRDVVGSPSVVDDAVITWDHATSKWEAGLSTLVQPIALENVTVAQPDYEIVVGTGAAGYTYGFTVPTPAAGKTGIQVFVNGIKQIEGGAKAYTVDYGTDTVTFNAGSIPAVSDDVEFYGFGLIG